MRCRGEDFCTNLNTPATQLRRVIILCLPKCSLLTCPWHSLGFYNTDTISACTRCNLRKPSHKTCCRKLLAGAPRCMLLVLSLIWDPSWIWLYTWIVRCKSRSQSNLSSACEGEERCSDTLESLHLWLERESGSRRKCRPRTQYYRYTSTARRGRFPPTSPRIPPASNTTR